MNCSIRPPGKTPNSLGPNFLSERRVKITDSVISDSKASSPCTFKQIHNHFQKLSNKLINIKREQHIYFFDMKSLPKVLNFI